MPCPTFRHSGFLVPLLVLPVFLPACSAPVSSNDLDELEEWSADLDLRVGSVDDPVYALTWFRSMEVNPDGRMYTVHPQEQLIRVFSPDGILAGTIGGRGDGPGEFQNVGAIGWVGDTIWVLDFNGYKFNFFSEDGEFISSFSVPFRFGEDPDLPSPPRASGLLSDGTVHGSPPAFSHQVEDGTITHHQLLLLSREGEVFDSIASIPFGRNQWAVYDPENPRSGMMYTRQPYGDGPEWGFFENELALAVLFREAPTTEEGAAFRLEKRTLTGDTIFSREYRYEPTTLRREEADSVLQAQVDQWSERGVLGGVTAARLASWAGRTFYRPLFKPPITQMVLADGGGFWLRGRPRDELLADWFYFDPDGNPVGRTHLPSGLQVFEADSQTIWGTERDELDVSYLVRYGINKGG